MTGFKYIMAGLGLIELVGVGFAWALVRAASRRPLYGPPLPPPNLDR